MVVEQKQKLFWNRGTKWNNLKPCRNWNSKFHQNKNHPTGEVSELVSLPRLSAASGAATAAASVNYKSCWNYSLPKFCESSTLVAGFKIERGFPNLGSSWFWDACTTLVLVLLSFSAACETETMNVYSRGKVRLLKRPLTSQSEVYWKHCSSQCSSQCFLLPVPRIKMLAYGTANSLHHWYR